MSTWGLQYPCVSIGVLGVTDVTDVTDVSPGTMWVKSAPAGRGSGRRHPPVGTLLRSVVSRGDGGRREPRRDSRSPSSPVSSGASRRARRGRYPLAPPTQRNRRSSPLLARNAFMDVLAAATRTDRSRGSGASSMTCRDAIPGRGRDAPGASVARRHRGAMRGRRVHARVQEVFPRLSHASIRHGARPLRRVGRR